MAYAKLTKQERIASRYIPAGYTLYRQENDGVIYASADHLHAIAYRGASGKSSWHYRFFNEAAFLDRVNAFFSSLANWQKIKDERKAVQNTFETSLKPGDILSAAWGYEQTNVSWFQVLSVAGKQTVMIREIAGHVTEDGGFMSGHSMPMKDGFCADSVPMKKRVSGPVGHESVRINSYMHAYPWDGKPEFCSWYG